MPKAKEMCACVHSCKFFHCMVRQYRNVFEFLQGDMGQVNIPFFGTSRFRKAYFGCGIFDVIFLFHELRVLHFQTKDKSVYFTT